MANPSTMDQDFSEDQRKQAAEDFGVPYVSPGEAEAAQRHFERPEINDPGFVTAIKSGVGQQASALARTAKDIPLIGGAGAVDALKRWGERTQENNPTVVHSLQDVVDHPIDTFKEGAGNAVAQMPANAGGGVAGRVIGGLIGARFGNAALGQKLGAWAGMAVPTLAQEYGAIRGTQDQEVADGNAEADDKLQALKGALPATAIEFGMGPQKVLGNIIGEGFEGTAKELAKKLAKETAGMSPAEASSYILKHGGKELLRQGAGEGAEELVQNPLEAWGAHQDPLSPETIDQSLTGAALGFGGGVATGGPMIAAQHYKAKSMLDSGQASADPAMPPAAGPAVTPTPANATPSGPLGQAAAAGQSAMPPAPAAPAEPVDPLAERITAMAPTIESKELMRQMRSDPRFGPQTVTDVLHAWSIGRNPNLDPKIRARALDGLETIFGPDNFNLGKTAPDTAIAGEAARVPNDPGTGQLSGPPAYPALPASVSTPPAELPPDVQTPSVTSPASVASLPISDSVPSAPSTDTVPSMESATSTESAPAGEMPDPSTGVKTDIQPPATDDVEAQVNQAFADVFGEEDAAPAAPQVVVDEAANLQAQIDAARADEQRTAARNLIRDRVAHGFTKIEGKNLINPKTGETHPLNNPAEILTAQSALRKAIDDAAHTAATSDRNDLAQPSDGQKQAGNYKKAHLNWNGLDLAIENPKGSQRSGVDPDGKAWSVTMPGHYGYAKKTLGADGDQVDIYLGESPHSNKVYVVDQIDAGTGKFDEHKAIGNVRSEAEAIRLYDAGFSDGKGPQRRGAITEMSVDQFKDWVKNGDTTKPIAYKEQAIARKPVEESDQERSLREWGENYNKVVNTPDLTTISTNDLERADAWASRYIAGERRKGWDGGAVNETIIKAMQPDVDAIKAELSSRYAQRDAEHRRNVERAMQDGQTIPADVLADYTTPKEATDEAQNTDTNADGQGTASELRAEEGGRTGGKGPAGPWTAGEIRDGDVAIIPAESYLSTEIPDDGSPDPVRPVDTAVIGRLLAERDAALGLTLPGIDERAGLPADLTITVGDDADAPAYAGRFDVAWRGNIITLHQGAVEDLDETDEIHGIPPLALPNLLDKNAESDGLGYWTVGDDPTPMDFLDAVEHAFVRLSAMPAQDAPAVSKLEVVKEKVKERAEVAKEEAKGNPAPVQEHATGSRVIISSDYYEKDLAGRHAVVTGFSTGMARITAIGLDHSGVYGRNERIEYSPSYSVKTDAGVALDYIYPSSLQAEGETAAPSVVPDIDIPTGPNGIGGMYTPNRLRDKIAYALRSAESNNAAAGRARLSTKKANLRAAASKEQAKASDLTNAYNAWAAKHGQPQIAWRGEQVVEMGAPAASASTTAPTSAAAPVAPTDTAGTLKAAGLVVKESTTKNGKQVWEVTGNTKEHVDLMKRYGGRWYGPKKAWSFYDADPSAKIAAALANKGVAPATSPAAPSDKAPEVPAAPVKKSARDYTGRTWRTADGTKKTVMSYQGGDTVTVATAGKAGTQTLTVPELEAMIAADTAANKTQPAPTENTETPIWQMTRAEYWRSLPASANGVVPVERANVSAMAKHEIAVRDRLFSGQPVPANVRADYPDILDDGSSKPKPFAANKIFTADKVAAARARLKAKLGTLNSGIDPELLIDGMTIAGAYIESGVRAFGDYAKAMVDDLGESVKPYLLSFYEAARAYPGLDNEGMTPAAEAQKAFSDLITPTDFENAKDVIGQTPTIPKKRAQSRNEALTLKQDWGVDSIDGWTESPTGKNQGSDFGLVGGIKDDFHADATRYLKQVAEILKAQGFTPHKDRKGKDGKPVNSSKGGPAVSGEISLSMRKGNFNAYVRVGGFNLRGFGGVPHPQGIGMMARVSRTSGDQYATNGSNQWLSAATTAGELADWFLEQAPAETEAPIVLDTPVPAARPAPASAAEAFDAESPETYAKVMADPELQEAHQDEYDDLFTDRAIAVRNALRGLGFVGDEFKPLSKNGVEVKFDFKKVGGGGNVVGVTIDGIVDDLTMTPEALAQLVAEQAAANSAPAPKAAPAYKWSPESLTLIKELVEQGKIVLVADGGVLGIPTIQDMPSDATRHMGFGTFKTETDDYEAVWDGGGAMQRTPDDQIGYTVVSLSRGTLPTSLYDPAAVLAKLNDKLGVAAPVVDDVEAGVLEAFANVFDEAEAPAAADKFASTGDSLNNAERELREAAHAEDRPGDVLLGNGRYVDFNTAVRLAREGIQEGAFKAAPAQLHFKLDLSMRDVDRVLEAATRPSGDEVVRNEAAKMEIVPIDGSTDYLVRMPHSDGRGYQNFARFGLSASGKPVKINHFFESSGTRAPVDLAIQNWAKANKPEQVKESKETQLHRLKMERDGLLQKAKNAAQDRHVEELPSYDQRKTKAGIARLNALENEERQKRQSQIDAVQQKIDRLTNPPAPTRAPSASKSATSAVKNVGMGLADVAKGLNALFKPKPGTLGSGPFVFDEDTYAQAKPYFAAGIAHFKQAGADIVAMATALIKHLRDQFGMDRETVQAMLPYITQYMRDVQSGKIVYDEENEGVSDESGNGTDRQRGRDDEVPPVGRGGEEETGRPGRDSVDSSAQSNSGGVGGVLPGNDGRTEQAWDRAGLRGRDAGEDVGSAGSLSEGGDALAGQPGRSGAGMADDVSAGGTGGSGRDRGTAGVRDGRLGNYHVADPEALIGGSPRVRFERNKAAIEAYQNVVAEGRQPTPAERDAMARYIGWGSFGQELFQGNWNTPKPKPEWRDADAWLREHLGQAEWESAQASIINAHYTDPPTVAAMWDMVRNMGFTGGRVLEPSMGIGNFYGLMPRDLMARSQLTGIEMDTLTGGMAKLLYPDANIQIKPYQDSKTADGFYDLVIGNWPFAAEAPLDRRYRRLSPTLHDYFFLKALDQTRAGGLVVGITSSGTLDKMGEATRYALARKADLVASFRLPSGAFEKYAGTSVVTDLLVFRKREDDNPTAGDVNWLKTQEIDTPAGSPIRVNSYYVENPGNVLGILNYGHGTTRGVPGMIVDRPADLMNRLAALPSKVPADAYAPAAYGKHISFIANHTDDRQQSITLGPDNGLYVVNGEHLTPLHEASEYRLKDAKKTAARESQIRDLIGLRRAYAALISRERAGGTEAETARKALNKLYKAFVKAHGFINESEGMKVLKKVGDPFHASLSALEVADGKTYRPATILSRPTMRATVSLENPSIRDAFVLARNQSMTLDMDALAAMAKRPVEEVIKDLTGAGAIFKTPVGNYEVADVYLSGNVRVKLREAEAAQQEGMDMAANIEALKAVIPPDMPYYRIEAKLGAPWVPAREYVNFIGEALGLQGDDLKDIKVESRMGRWAVQFDNDSFNRRPEAQTVWGVDFYPFSKLVRAALNNGAITIRERDPDGNLYVDTARTAEVNAKVAALREHFSTWVWADIDRRIALEKDYNEVMRAVAEPHFDGSFMAMEGMALQRGDNEFSLRQHQTNAIWRGLVNRRGIYAHEVGPQPLDAKILTPSGWTTMGEVKPGMMVVAADGTPTAVEAIYPKGEKTVYRVIFSDGSSTECCDDHLWLTSTYAERNYAARQGDKDWPCATPKVRPLHEIRQELRAPHLSAKNHRIPIVSPVQFAERPLALAPYLLGALLGDGGLSGRGVVLTTADSEIADACRLHLPAGAKMERVKATGRCATWTLTSADAVGRNAKGCINPVKDALDALALRGKSSHDKFIPDDYLFNTIENRIELLRGLMDTDGSVAKGGHSVYFYTTSARLKDGVVALVQSLGGTVSVREKRPTYTHLGEKRAGRLCYVLCLKLPATVNPFRLPRKASAVVSKTSYAPARYIVDVQPVGTKPVQCIRVAHPDHLYVTDDFIVTHNTGKTYTMGGLAVESRRYGLAKKPIIFAHNANSAAVAAEIQEMYPAAKLLYINNLSPNEIDVRMRQIANDDWDAVIVPHSLITRFALTKETLAEISREEIAALEEEAITAAGEDNANLTVDMMDDEEAMARVRSATAKELVRARNAILARIDDMAMRASKENAIPFEELGIDMVIVDEAHEFKKPPLVTRMKMKGLNRGISNQSIAMRFLTDYVKRQNNGNGIHMFTGTPITNTLSEIYNMQRYVADDQMQRDGVKDWDSWFATFADSKTDVELTATGDYDAVTRLAMFINTADLRNMIGSYTDIVFADDMPEFAPRHTSTGKTLNDEDLTDAERAELLNGKSANPIGRPYKKIVNDVAAMSPEQEGILRHLQSLANSFKNASKKDRREMSRNHVSAPMLIDSAAPAAGLDPRLYDLDAPDNPDLKVNRCARNVLAHFNEDQLATQVVFVDRGYSDKTERVVRDPNGWAVKGPDGKSLKETVLTFNLVKDLIEKLVKGGIARDQIAIVNAEAAPARRKEIAADMNSGKIRVVIGMTKTLGIGVNMQKHLRAMHHMDAPWMPGELEQRNGRGQRQGNEWNTIYEYRYITDRVDGRRWQVLAVKDRFIKQFLKADADTRIIEGDAVSEDDDSDILSSLSEAAGDPRIMLRQKYMAEVERLENRLRMHDMGRDDARRRVGYMRQEIARKKKVLADIRGDSAVAAALNARDEFSIVVNDKTFTKRQEADAEIKDFVEKLEPRTRPYTLGRYGDFTFTVTLPSQNSPLTATLTGPSGADYVIKASVASIESVLRNLAAHADKMEAAIVDSENSIPRLIESAEAEFPRAAELTRKQTLLKQLDADLQLNPVPPPPWLRQGAPINTMIYVGNKGYVVEGHQHGKEGFFVVVATPNGSRRVPYALARDEQGMNLYDEHDFTAPPDAIPPLKPGDNVVDGNGNEWKLLREPRVEDDIRVVNAKNLADGTIQDIRADGLRHTFTQLVPIPILEVGDAEPTLQPATEQQKAQANAIALDEAERVTRGASRFPWLVGGRWAPLQDDMGSARFSKRDKDEETKITPADKAVYGMVAEGQGTAAILKFIASASRNPFYRQLARLLIQTGTNPAVMLADTKGWKFNAGQNRKYSAAYNPDTDTVALFRVPSAERHFLHELMHATTLKALEKKGLAAVKLRALYAQVKKTGKLKGMYGMTDIDEFIAEAFTNPFFQEKLKGIKVNEGAGLVKNAWHWFVRIVRGILGLKEGQENALSAVMELGVGVMRENMALDRSTSSRTRYSLDDEGPTPITGERLPATIRVDGTDRPTMNSEGRQIHPSRSGVENFWRWFDGVRPEGLGEAIQSSKDASGVFGADHGTTRGLDADGRPRIFYHGTATAIDAFDLEHPERKDSGWLGRGVYLTTDADLAESYANIKGNYNDQTVMPLYAAVKNPFYATLELKKRLSKATQAQIDAVTNNMIRSGFDGVVLEFNDDTAEVVAFSPEQVKSASGNSGGFDPNNPRIRYSSAADPSAVNGTPAIESVSDILRSPNLMQSIRQQVADQFATQKTFNWWHKTIGSQFHKAKIDTLPGKAAGELGTFGAVYDRAQQYLDDTSRLANEAADLAPGLLPKTNGLMDAVNGIKNLRRDARDAQAIAGPVFQGTLRERIFTNAELRKPPLDEFGKPMFAPLTDAQIVLYQQYRATIDKSLDDLAISEMARLSDASKMLRAPSGLSLRDTVAFYEQQYGDLLDEARTNLEELRAKHAQDLRLLDDAAKDQVGKTDELNKFARMREAMKSRQAAELQSAERALANLEELDKGINGRAEAIEKIKGQGYSPLMRFGQYTVDVFYEDENGKPLTDADGVALRPFFGMYESEALANKVARALRAEYPDATIKQGVMSQHSAAMFKGVTPETLEIFGQLIGADQDQAFQNYLKLAVNNRSAMKRLIHRLGVQGFSDDPTRVLASFVTSNARAAAGNYHLGEMLRATSAIPQHKGDVKDEAVKLLQYLQNPADEGAWVRSLLFANYLGGSVASALVNLTQTFTTTVPYLHQFGGNTTGNVLAAMKLAKGRMGKNKQSTGDAELDRALKRAEEEGIVAPHEMHTLQGESARSGVLSGNRVTRNLMKVWGSFFSIAEQYNREVAFIAAYKVAKTKGMTGQNAYQFASDAVSQTQFQYSKASRGNWGRGAVGATLLTFKTFTVNYLEFLKRLPPKERALAMAIIFLAAGAQGLPFADDLDDLIDTIMQTLGFSWNTKQQKRAAIASVLGESAAGFIQYGVSYGLPIDISGRLGLSNLIPGTAVFKPSETNKTRDVAEIFGAAGGAVQQAFDAFSQIQRGDLLGGARALSPKAVRDLVKGGEMAATGYYTDTRGRRVADTTLVDAAAKTIGFQPTRIAEDSRARSIVMDQSSLFRATQGEIHSMWAEGIVEGDQDKITQAQERLRNWNMDNPESKIVVSRSAILRRVQQARLTADQRLINTAPKTMRSQLRPTLEGNY